MNREQRTNKIEEMGDDNIYAKVVKEEIDAMKAQVKKSTIEKADDMDQVRGARIALKYFDKLKRRIDRPSTKRDGIKDFIPDCK